jgi:hypothetical protein
VREETTRALQASLTSALRSAISKPYLTNQEVSELTGWTKRQLAHKRASGALPFLKRGRTIWYRAEEVYSWLEEGHVPAKIKA